MHRSQCKQKEERRPALKKLGVDGSHVVLFPHFFGDSVRSTGSAVDTDSMEFTWRKRSNAVASSERWTLTPALPRRRMRACPWCTTGATGGNMGFLAMAIPIAPGKTEQWLKFTSELKGPRRAEFVA